MAINRNILYGAKIYVIERLHLKFSKKLFKKVLHFKELSRLLDRTDLKSEVSLKNFLFSKYT